MKTPLRTLVPAAFFALGLLCSCAAGGEVLINENFDAFNLDTPPAGWTKGEPTQLSLVAEAGHGKVLKLVNKDNKYPHLTFTLDTAKTVGKTLNISIAAKFPGVYVPIADKLSASPKLAIIAKDAAGKSLLEEGLVPQAGKAEWQELKKTVAIPATATSVTAQICIQNVTCEVFFDNLKIEFADAPAPAPVAVAPPTPPAVAPKPVTPATPVDPITKWVADKAPRKSFEDGGMVFGPEYAVTLQKTYPSKTVTAGTAMFIGSGIPDKAPPYKLSTAWRALPMQPKLIGATATPRALLASLPEVLAKDKPEVVFISSDPAPGRKPTSTESDDWEDVAHLCIRYGAMPIYVPFPNETKDEQYDRLVQSLKKAVSDINYPSVSPVPAEAFAKRADNLLKLLDMHVFMRAKISDPSKPTTGKVVDE